MTSNLKKEQEAEELVQAEAERALNVFEETRNEPVSAVFEARTARAAAHAKDVIESIIADEGGVSLPVEERALKDMDKVIAAEEDAMKNAAKNDLFFEDRAAIKGEEAAADAVGRTEQYRKRAAGKR